MSIRIWNGEVKISVKVFYVLAILFIAMILISVEIYIHERNKAPVACIQLPRRIKIPKRRVNGKEHQGCSRDPVLYNTPESCPECFRPTVNKISERFEAVNHNVSIFPRAPPGYFKPREKRQQELVRKILIEPESMCVETCPYLVALQMSVTDKIDERNTIRSTWASVSKTRVWPNARLNAEVEVIFVLAHQSIMSTLGARKTDPVERSMTKEEWTLVTAEADRYGDVLYLDMVDSYYNLSLKVISALQWARDHCPRTKFFLKVDADTFVNVPLLVDLLIYNRAMLDFSVVGYIYKYAPVFRTGRWAVSKELYPLHMFPIYASGCTYIISNKALGKFLEIFPYMPIMMVEDAYITGILGRFAKVHYFSQNHHYHFTAYQFDYWSWCEFLNDTRITGTGVNRDFKMRLIWSGFILNDWVCEQLNFLQMYCRCWEEFPASHHSKNTTSSEPE